MSGYSESDGNPEKPAVVDLLFQAVSEEASAPGKEHPALFLLMRSMWNPPRLLVFCKVCRLGPGWTLKRLWSMQKERESARTRDMACGSGAGTRRDFVPTCVIVHVSSRRRLLFFCAGTLRSGTITTLSDASPSKNEENQDIPTAARPDFYMPIHSSDITSRNNERHNAFVERGPFLCVLSIPLPHCRHTKNPQPSVLDPPGGALRLKGTAGTFFGNPLGGKFLSFFFFFPFFPFFLIFLMESRPEMHKEKPNLHHQKEKPNSNTRSTTEKKRKTFWDFGFAFHEMFCLKFF